MPGEFKFCKTPQEIFRLVFTIEAELGVIVFAGASLVAQMVKKVKMKVAQSCQNLCNTMDYAVNGILQARILEWVAIPFCRGSSQPRDQTQVSHIAGRFFTSRATREAQEYWKERKKESEVAQLCSIVWDPMDCSLSGSSIRGIFQARLLE